MNNDCSDIADDVSPLELIFVEESERAHRSPQCTVEYGAQYHAKPIIMKWMDIK